MKGDLPVAILQIVDATAQNRVDLSPLGGIKKMREDESLCLLFYDEIGFYLREAEELTLATKEQTILAEADQIDALASQRDFDLELRLVPLAESEGQLLVDRGNTVTGELRRRAGETRMRAAAVRERLSEFQKTRRSL